ncbi:MAG TPA: regulator [Bacteroidales bacterium]|nr:MAG: regulator [Bacteroidetes bacterium GWF2_33_38]OFY84740.1 MAG: regulator [Bacteroidetes bacterium RIFOXYA2_FULL_33_7]HBF88905.1 regulator [Bacteroidales bacterium]
MNNHIQILLVDDDSSLLELLSMNLMMEEKYDVTTFLSGKDFLEFVKTNDADIVVLDYNLQDVSGIQLLDEIKKTKPQIPIIFLSGQNDVNVVVDAYNKGAKNYIVKSQNAIVELVNAIKNVAETVVLKKQVEYWQEQIINRSNYEHIIGESPAIMKVLKLIQKVEKTNILTLITGDSGTGKELVAKAIHFNSDRRKKPFVAVNIAALPDDLVESELFGYEKGAFTGADSRRTGKFEEANDGTIFLDEIGELDLNMQTKLLRVLQDNIITRLGSNKEIQLNTRIVAATNKNLAQSVKEGTFREDLYYRLQVFLIQLPPLRERGNDVIILCKYFVNEFCKSNKMQNKIFTAEAYRKILAHSWPGNIRELKSFVERSILVSDGQNIDVDDLIFSP